MKRFFIVLLSLVTFFAAGSSFAGKKNKALKSQEEKREMLTKLGGGDFVHPGDKESIEFLLRKLENIDHLKIGNTLDLGSAYGGTADYLMKKGFKKIWALGRDPNSIAYAKSKYPAIKFLDLDTKEISKKLKKDSFSFIYSFNALDSIEDKEELLKNLATISEDGAVLAIFESTRLKHKEYVNDKNIKEKPPVFKDLNGKILHPIEVDKFSKLLKITGWEITDSTNTTKEYIEWYEILTARMKTHRADFLKNHSEKSIEEIENLFQKLLFNLKHEKLGARLIIARKIYSNRK